MSNNFDQSSLFIFCQSMALCFLPRDYFQSWCGLRRKLLVSNILFDLFGVFFGSCTYTHRYSYQKSGCIKKDPRLCIICNGPVNPSVTFLSLYLTHPDVLIKSESSRPSADRIHIRSGTRLRLHLIWNLVICPRWTKSRPCAEFGSTLSGQPCKPIHFFYTYLPLLQSTTWLFISVRWYDSLDTYRRIPDRKRKRFPYI